MILTNSKYFLSRMYNYIKVLFLLVFRKPACFVECVYTLFYKIQPGLHVIFCVCMLYGILEM